jgi:hypothetical protein
MKTFKDFVAEAPREYKPRSKDYDPKEVFKTSELEDAKKYKEGDKSPAAYKRKKKNNYSEAKAGAVK